MHMLPYCTADYVLLKYFHINTDGNVLCYLVDIWYKPTILKAIEEFHKHTCIRFVPHTIEKNWIEFDKQAG